MSFGRILFCCFMALVPQSAKAIEASDFWRTFRSQNPLFTQDVVASPFDDKGNCLVIVSEPPPHLAGRVKEAFGKIFKEAYQSHELFTQQIGFDGWVKDIVVRLHYSSDERLRLDRDIAALNVELFGTDYKASYSVLELKDWSRTLPVKRLVGPPNLRVNAASLNRWLLEAPINFVSRTPEPASPIMSAAETSAPLATILGRGLSGVFHSEAGGELVALVLNRDEQLNGQRSKLRQFFLDSDLVIGAVAPTSSSDKLLTIIGRRREASVRQMPPLRTETILTLAATNEQDLAQSYERNSPLAGQSHDPDLIKFLNAGDIAHRFDPKRLHDAADWAPILLSRELTNTEYGNLLNVTDQLLKGWSSSNTITYGNFPYLDSIGGPPSVRDLLPQGIRTLTFNWNTAGFGSWTRFGSYEIFAVNQTGALPVSYLVDDASFTTDAGVESAFIEAEDTYERFFGGYRDPNLIRAAQYAALHVVFRRFKILAQREEPSIPSSDYQSRWKPLEEQVATVLTELPSLAQLSTKESEAVAAERRCKSFGNFNSSITPDWNESKSRLARIVKDQSAPQLMLLSQIIADRRSLSELNRDRTVRVQQFNTKVSSFKADVQYCESPSARRPLICSLSALEARGAALQQEKVTIDALENQISALSNNAKTLAPAVGAFRDCNKAWRSIVAIRKEQPDQFVKTPTIVVSHGQMGYGGHNLDGRSAQIILNSTIRPGEFRFDAQKGILELNPRDAAQGPSAARSAERLRKVYETGTPAQKARAEKRIRESLLEDSTIKPLHVAVETESATSTARTLGVAEAGDSRRVIGWQHVNLSSEQISKLLAHANDNGAQVVVQKEAATWRIFNASGQPPYMIESATIGGFQRAIEATVETVGSNTLNKSRSVVVISDGSMSPGDLASLRLTAEARHSPLNSGGSGLPPKPPNGLAAATPGDYPPERSFSFRNDARRLVQIFARNRKAARTLLDRTDADWARAKVTFAEVQAATKSGMVEARLEVPFKERLSFTMQIQAFFKRIVTENDRNALRTAVEQNIAAIDLDPSVEARIIAIREGFTTNIADTDLRFRLESSSQDFYVVDLQFGNSNVSRRRIVQ